MMARTSELSHSARTDAVVNLVDVSVYGHVHAHFFSVWSRLSFCSDLGPDCTRSLTACTLHLFRALNIFHPSHWFLPVTDCVWNHLVSLRCSHW